MLTNRSRVPFWCAVRENGSLMEGYQGRSANDSATNLKQIIRMVAEAEEIACMDVTICHNVMSLHGDRAYTAQNIVAS